MFRTKQVIVDSDRKKIILEILEREYDIQFWMLHPKGISCRAILHLKVFPLVNVELTSEEFSAKR